MKCEKCGNEAVFHYQSNINGEKSEYHLCANCARAEGFGEMLDFRPRSMFDNFWRDPFGGFMDGFFGSPFSPLTDGFFGRRLFAPTLTLPSVNISVGWPEKTTECECGRSHNIPEDAGDEFRKKRELHALKHQLKAAIKAEEFEKAAELRDKIRELEK
ncbi:MAG: hypothetical protein GX488_06910 [Clostridiales bacterium]|nr:hypothetical protein [Clostridiales bacterium]